jgi:hypothetical protein
MLKTTDGRSLLINICFKKWHGAGTPEIETYAGRGPLAKVPQLVLGAPLESLLRDLSSYFPVLEECAQRQKIWQS